MILPGALLLLILALYGFFEYNNSRTGQLPESPEPIIEESLDQGLVLFENFQADLTRDTENLLEQLQEIISQQQNRQFIYRSLSNHDFWGVILYRNGIPWSWNGFHIVIPPPFESSQSDSVQTYLQKRNNLSVLVAQVTFSVEDDSYQLVAGRKLSHTTNLPIAGDINFTLSDHPSLTNLYPVRYSFSQPPPDSNMPYRVLATSASDSVGVVYAEDTDYEAFKASFFDAISESRYLFHIAIIAALFLFFIVFAVNHKSWYSLLFQIGFISLMWFLAVRYSVAESWGMLFLPGGPDDVLQTQLILGEYLLNALFLLLFSLVAINTLRGYNPVKSRQMQIKGALIALMYGVVQLLLILFFVISTKQLTADTAIPLLDLELIPPLNTLIFYISASLFFAAITGISLAVSQFLFKFEQDKAVLIFLSSVFAFLATSFGIDQFTDQGFFLGWQFLLILFLFSAFIFTGWLMSRYPDFFTTMSGFRRMIILLLFTAGSVYYIIWNTTPDRADSELHSIATEYAAEAESDSEAILRSILQTIEFRIQDIPDEDIFETPERAQSRFERVIESLIQTEWQNYTLDFHLVRADGDMISDYSTSIDSPGWSSIFDLELMNRSHRGEQLRMETNRPIIWDRPTGIGEHFRSFFRGWIPIYSNTNPGNIIAWITGSIYQERPDFNKPIRAVMTATTGEDWRKSFYMAEFTGNRVVRSATKGIYNDQPEYNRLSDVERNIAMQDSLAFITTRTAQGSFREILLRVGDRNIVKVSTPKPGFTNHLFSFFRLFLPLLFFGLFVMAVLSICGLRPFHLFSQSKRFQNRLIDGFTLATLLFLTVLIFATQFAISNQTEKNIERDLVNTLKNLGESIQLASPEISTDSFQIPLSDVTTPLNVDAILYQNVWVVESTTPQIFQQHLIPTILPFNAYEFLYNRERRHIVSTVELGRETLMVGYRAIVDDDNQPVGTIAIPTFTQSPVYTDQLLETTSYLFGIYLVIFSLFTIGAIVFSNQLTRPLELIQKGLNKISRGEQKTKIPVTSQDEVGSLAEAYNLMVNKLDEAQKELIKAERESAWKEMAQQVAHEIKNPLTPMKLNLQHLQRQLEANPDNVLALKPIIETTAANIIEQIESLNKIASDFSKFSKPIRDPFEPVNLNPLLESVADLYGHDEGVEIELNIRSKDLTIHCVQDEIRRVLINLIKNGIEACENGNSKIQIDAGFQNEELEISIADNGIGIPVKNRNTIFVPNFSTKSSGTGLGLAITKKIIEAHDGDISFESKPGQGTTFTIHLPKKPSSS
ncbi:HAMP domain-containing sensor histidine kinase [Rhodohalobacter sp. SW132]|uniref:sensor histidine kinase n=1 Tax=Rhodohalobacter sp. SW132 TaxID=2293433 RepID=UPI0011C03634|nr:HAMP domain-containing sensor histidine kinase [Rhodohalobacter sp. SW132]